MRLRSRAPPGAIPATQGAGSFLRAVVRRGIVAGFAQRFAEHAGLYHSGAAGARCLVRRLAVPGVTLLQRNSDDDLCSDPQTRALSAAVVESSFVEAVYNKIAVIDDWLFGATLHTGRLEAIRKLDLQPGDDVLEVGVGTGINATLYPDNVTVTGIDVAEKMLEKAARRLAAHKVRNVSLMQMDAAHLDFPDDSFDLVYAPYVMSVVSDPVAVAREMRRVCRPGGRFRLPQSLPQRQSLRRARRAPHLAAHRLHRLQGRSGPAGIPRPGRSDARLDREGQHSPHLVARYLYQGLIRGAAPPGPRQPPAPRSTRAGQAWVGSATRPGARASARQRVRRGR